MENQLTVIGQTIALNPLTAYSEQIQKGTEALKTVLEVKSQTQLEQASDYLNRAKKLAALVNKEVENLCRPLKDAKKDIDEAQRKIKAFADEVLKPLAEVTLKLEQNILAFSRAEMERVAKEKLIAQAKALAEANQANQAETEGEYDFNEPVKTSAPIVEAPKVKGMTTTWAFEIMDPVLVPRELCAPNEVLIRQAIKDGSRVIPGVRVYEDTKIRRT